MSDWIECSDAEKLIMDDKEYFALRGDLMAAGRLKLFNQSPKLFHLESIGALPAKERTRSLDMGTAVHLAKLQPDEFSRRVVVDDPPVNPNTGAPYGTTSKAHREWVESHGDKIVLTHLEHIKVLDMVESIDRHSHASMLLNNGGDAEIVVRGSLHNVPCIAKLDFVKDDSDWIVDLKTVDDIDRINVAFFRWGYDIQAAFYQMLIKQLTGRWFDFYFVFVEKQFPYTVAVVQLSQFTIETARDRVSKLLVEYRHCVQGGTWPTRYEEVILL